MTVDAPLATHRVVVLLLAPVVGFDAAIAPQVLGSARDAQGRRFYDVTVAGLTAQPVAGEYGYDLLPQTGCAVLAEADTVIIPGTTVAGPRTDGSVPPQLADALRLIRPGTRLVSICTGAFVLAAAGWLDGRPATTHWAYAADFRALYPAVDLDENRLFVDDGDVLTSAGLAAGVDLCLHLIRRDHGAAVANRAARHCVVPAWRDGGQAQFIQRAVPELGQASTAPVRHWAGERLDTPLDVEQLAGRARMSVRTFHRRFVEETGTTPGAWVAARRLDHARHLLESSDLPVDEVARRAGLGTGASLRHHLRAAIGLSPLAYRRRFRDPSLSS